MIDWLARKIECTLFGHYWATYYDHGEQITYCKTCGKHV